MKLRGKNVLVTGAGGFIGSHLVEALLHRGCSVRAFVHYNSFNRYGWLDHLEPPVRRAIEVVPGDIRDFHGVAKAARGREVIFHLAALIGIPYSYHSPASYVDTNVTGTLNVLQAAREAGTERVIQTSTSEVYGSAQSLPIDEEHPLHPQSPYAATKVAADALALSFQRSFRLPVAVIRPFNTYGPRQSARAVIPNIIAQIKSGEHRIKLGSLHPTRDYTFVKDTAEGFMALAEAEGAAGTVTNIGSGAEISVGALARMIAELMGVEIEIVAEEERLRPEESEVARLLADVSRAVDLFGWAPAHSLRQGIEETIAWFAIPENMAFYKPDLYAI